MSVSPEHAWPEDHRLNSACLEVQVWLQEFAWTEKDVPRKLKARAAKLPGNAALASEPIFCFELAIRLFYWSCLVYTYEEVRSST